MRMIFPFWVAEVRFPRAVMQLEDGETMDCFDEGPR